MATLQNRRTVFSLTNSEVMSNSAPSTEAGITKSEGHDGFFIYSDKAFTLWFKDQAGNWASYNTYNLIDLDDGIAFSWGTNTAAFVQSGEASHSIAVFIIETKDINQYKNIENKTLNETGFNRLEVHSNYKRVRMENSGHTGEAYAIAIFDDNGDAAYISAPPSGQREGKALGWDENGDLAWVSLSEPGISQHLEESASASLVADAVITNGILDLDGTGDYLSIPHNLAYDRESGDMSVMLWFKPRAIGYLSTLISKGTGPGAWNGWIMSITKNGLAANDLYGNSMANGGFRFFNSAGPNDIKYLAPAGGIVLDQWHHICLVMKQVGSYEFYYDGALLGTFAPSSKSTFTNGELLMGANKDGTPQPAYNRMFNGMIDGVTIEKEALTSEQIISVYNNEAPE